MPFKTCTKCLKIKGLEYFSPRYKKYSSRCRECCNEDKRKKYHSNITIAREKSRIYRSKNKGNIKTQNHLSYLANRENRIEYQKRYAKKNRTKINQWYRTWRKKRYYNNIQFRIRSVLCRRIHHLIKGQIGSTEKYIGCSREELVSHIESKFKEGMNWDNYGFRSWHIDHIKPISSFDLTKEDERCRAFSYKNLQPLWALENLKKGKNETYIQI